VFARLRKLRARRGQSGAAALEFGLIAGTIFLPLLLGLIQYGWYFYVAQTTGGAATHVARRLAVGDCWGSGEALTFVKNEVASDPNLTTLAFTPTSNSSAVIGTTQLTVTVTADGDLIGFVPMPNSGTITRSVKTMIEDTTSSGTC
jgi:Flp pilus assembly protein TadG